MNNWMPQSRDSSPLLTRIAVAKGGRAGKAMGQNLRNVKRKMDWMNKLRRATTAFPRESTNQCFGRLMEATRGGKILRGHFSDQLKGKYSPETIKKLIHVEKGRGDRGLLGADHWAAKQKIKTDPNTRKELRAMSKRLEGHKKYLMSRPQGGIYRQYGLQAIRRVEGIAQRIPRKEYKRQQQQRKLRVAVAMGTSMPIEQVEREVKKRGATVKRLASWGSPYYWPKSKQIDLPVSDDGRVSVPAAAHEGALGGGHHSQRPKTATYGDEDHAWRSGIRSVRKSGHKFNKADARFANMAIASYTNPRSNPKARKFFRKGGYRKAMGITESTNQCFGRLLEAIVTSKKWFNRSGRGGERYITDMYANEFEPLRRYGGQATIGYNENVNTLDKREPETLAARRIARRSPYPEHRAAQRGEDRDANAQFKRDQLAAKASGAKPQPSPASKSPRKSFVQQAREQGKAEYLARRRATGGKGTYHAGGSARYRGNPTAWKALKDKREPLDLYTRKPRKKVAGKITRIRFK